MISAEDKTPGMGAGEIVDEFMKLVALDFPTGDRDRINP